MCSVFSNVVDFNPGRIQPFHQGSQPIMIKFKDQCVHASFLQFRHLSDAFSPERYFWVYEFVLLQLNQ